MPRDIHLLMKDSDRVDRGGLFDRENHVTSYRVTPVPASDLVASTASLGVSCDSLYCLPNLEGI